MDLKKQTNNKKYIAENWYKKTNSKIAGELKISERYVRVIGKELNLPDKSSDKFKEVLQANNFVPPTWKDGWLKTKEASIRIVNKEDYLDIREVKDEMIREMKKYSPKFTKLKRGKTEPHLLVIDPGDVHINKLALDEETGDEYNIQIALQRVREATQKILERSKPYNIEKIMLVIGNDCLHTDNKSGTTAGTPQDMDTLWHRAFKVARQMYVEVIEQLVKEADVYIVYNPSNHDYYSGFMLSDALYCWFHKHPNISWDINIKHRKYFTYGKNLIGTSHGDGARENDLPMLMATEAKDWSKTKYRYIYLHHVHHKRQIKYMIGDKQQITIEYMRSPSGADGWHDRNGYRAMKSIEGFIHHKEGGQVCRLTVNF